MPAARHPDPRSAHARLLERIDSEGVLIALALELGARSVPGWSEGEALVARRALRIAPSLVVATQAQIRDGADPLGDAFCRLRSPETRRAEGAVYTPERLVSAMVEWTGRQSPPQRVVDPGAGSGRFSIAAGVRFPDASLMAIEPDPVAALTARANLAVFGFADRAQVVSQDFRSLTLPPVQGPTLYVGNPPYVRHHLVEPKWKRWLTDEAARFGIQASQLAGLHVYFFLQVARLARASDYGVFVTSAEWLDVNYGHTVRELFLNRLGGRSITLIEPEAMPFADAASTAVVTTFKVASQAPTSAKFARVASLDALGTLTTGRSVRRERLAAEKRWTHLTRPGVAIPSGYVELGELCRVHRGQVTGNNKVWIANEDDYELPDDVLFPSVTKARDLIALKSGVLTSSKSLKRVIDLPSDLDVLGSEARRLVETFLKAARSLGAHTSYTARHRRAWWTVGLREPAPILATYMARRPPAFVLNQANARHINIAHGLYPRDALSHVQLTRLTEYLRKSATQAGGRTYAGGLTKFEPREMERFAVPTPAMLEAGVH